MKKLLCSLYLLSFLASAQQIAITIDDFPFRRMGLPQEEEPEMIALLYAHLEKFDIEATGFLNAGGLRPQNISGVEDFINKGHKMGNHTFQHSNVDQVGAASFIRDVDKGREFGKPYINSTFFRYPYLRRGKTLERRDSVYAHLAEKGYNIAHVSIDNDEWIYNRDYVNARKKGLLKEMDSIANAYLAYMKEVSLKYEEDAQKLLGRSVKHILLIHANPINAFHLDELLQWYQDQGWEFITLEEASKDPMYSMEGNFVTPYGWSIIDKIRQMTKDQVSSPADK